MANQPRFETEDLERLLKAIIPSNVEDPFGRLEELLLQHLEDELKDDVLREKFRKEVFEELADIKTRTFGILILQIFRTIKFFLGLLPQGRLILLAVAAVGLVTVLMDEGEVSGEAIRAAVANTGFAKFIDDVMEEINVFVGEVADQTQLITDAGAEAFVSIAGNLDQSVENLQFLFRDLDPVPFEDVERATERIAGAQATLGREIQALIPVSNSAANSADILVPIMRGLDDRIRTIPSLALKLVRIG